MSSSDDKKLPTSTLARSFSAQLHDIFLLDDDLSIKEKEVEQKKLELTQRNAELDALEARLKAAEALLEKKAKRISLLTGDFTNPTPANTEVGNPLSPGGTKRRNPIPSFDSAEPEAEGQAGENGEHGIADESAPEPPKKDDPVALQAPRALPGLGREKIEARERERRSRSEEKRDWGGEVEGGGGGEIEGEGPEGEEESYGNTKEYKFMLGVASADHGSSFFTSPTFASPDVPKHEKDAKQDKIEITTSFLEKKELSEGYHPGGRREQQQQTGLVAEPYHTIAIVERASIPSAAQQQATFPKPVHDGSSSGKRSFDSEKSEPPVSITGQGSIRVKPDEDGDEEGATGDLIDQYDYDSEEPSEEPKESDDDGHNPGQSTGMIDITFGLTSPLTIPGLNVSSEVSASAVTAASRPDRSESLRGTEASSSQSQYETAASSITAVLTQESANTKYLVNESLSLAQTTPRRAPTVTKTELPPLPGQSSDIPRRKPVRGLSEASPPVASIATTLLGHEDRPPTPPSKTVRNVNSTLLQQEYNRSTQSIESTSTGARSASLVSPVEPMSIDKPLPPTSPSDNSLDAPVRESIQERGFGGLLKMKKSLQGLRKKAQASSPISPSDQQRSFSAGAAMNLSPSDQRPKDEPPLPPIPPEKLAAANASVSPTVYTLSPYQSQHPVSPSPPSSQVTSPSADIFDRIQSTYPNQQQQSEETPRKFEAKHKKTIEAIAKFSGKMSALRSLRKKDTKEDSPPISQEPPLAAWEIEQRANPKPNPYGLPVSPPPSLTSPNQPPQSPYPPTPQTRMPQSNGYAAGGFTNNQNPMSPPQQPIKDDALPPPPPNDDDDLPATPSKSDLVLPKRVQSLATSSPPPPPPPEKSESRPSSRPDSRPSSRPDSRPPSRPSTGEKSISSPERPPRTTSKPIGLSIFPSASSTRPVVLHEPEQTPPAQLSNEIKQAELPPPPPTKREAFKPATLQLSASDRLAVDKPQPSPGLAPPLSPGFVPGRNGRTETYSFLGDYYFGDDQDGEAQEGYDDGEPMPDTATLPVQRSPPRVIPVTLDSSRFEQRVEPLRVEQKTEIPKVEPKVAPVKELPRIEPVRDVPRAELIKETPRVELPRPTPPKTEPFRIEAPRMEPPRTQAPTLNKKESDEKINFRIKSFAPFSLGDFGSSFSFDSFGTSSEEERKPPPVPSIPDIKTLPKLAPITSTLVSQSTPISAPKPAPAASARAPERLAELPPLPPKDDRRSPVLPDPAPPAAQSDKSLPEAPKPIQRAPSKSESKDKYPAPLQTIAHRSILTSTIPTGRESVGLPPLPMKDIPEEGPYPSSKSPLSSELSLNSLPGSATSSTTSAAPAIKAGYASTGVSSVISSVRSSSGYTESPSAASSTPRTSLTSSVNGPTSSGSGTPRVSSGEHTAYPARNSSQGYQQRSRSKEVIPERRIQSGTPGLPTSVRPSSNLQPGPPPSDMPLGGPSPGPGPRGPPPPHGMPPRGRMPGPPPGGPPPEMRGRPGFRPSPGGGPMGPGYGPRSASPAFSERSMRPPRGPPPPRSSSPAFSERRGPPPPRSSSPAFSERRGPPPPRSSSPAYSMRADSRMGLPPRGSPLIPQQQQQHQRRRSNSMEVLNFAVDFELPASHLKHEEKNEPGRRARSESNTGSYGGRGPPPGAFRGRAESPGPREPYRPGSRAGSRAGSRGPPNMPPGLPLNGPSGRPGSRAESPYSHAPPPGAPNGWMPPRGPPGSRRNSGGSTAGGGGRRPSMSEADLDIALGVGQIPGQERKYRPPPQMRGPRPQMPHGGPPPQMPPGQAAKGLKGLMGGPGGVTYPGLDDGFGLMDGGRMPTPSMPRREEMT
ncbi:hypothetical protein TWF694_002061 [Orbilia ellipsospora]|uniref:Uncharacterized protein n=1 Tax=Orbilia ellipsospora TaxID=2528407 RepID=A0AAV9X4G1_9PEZI